VVFCGVIKNSVNAFLSVILTQDNDSQENRRKRVIKRRGHFYGR
jgi:hypothetical protein